MEKIVYTYYSLVVGQEPEEKAFKRTLATANYLKDNGYTEAEILDIFKSIHKEIITGEDLPKELWNESLLEKDKFYYSDILHIKSKAPTWDPITYKEIHEPFYLEMRIRFTIDDLLNYYYEKCKVALSFRNKKKDSGAFNHLINKYNNHNSVAGIDYVIALIELASKNIDCIYTNVFDIQQYEKEVIEYFNNIYEQSVYEKTNLIIWREE